MRNWYELLPVLASTRAFLAWNVLYYERNKRIPLLLVSYAVREMFSPDYGCKKLILFQYEFSYNRENLVLFLAWRDPYLKCMIFSPG